VSQAVKAIRSGRVTKGDDGHLRLPPGLKWPEATNNVLFIRNVYAPLLEHVLDFCKPRKPHEHESTDRRIVSGQPGIGKTTWM